ncbi:prolyl oligopeptidase family serine peptidase [Shewanella waksmanii]|uniref:S9 family peptidase n=1 Tax=Shewanella waksmanii TaxID=213783 RepID=UPI0037358A4A
MAGLLKTAAISAVAIAVLSGCTATPTATQSASVTTTQAPVTNLVAPPSATQPLTMKQIMADPDWMGVLAKGEYWSDDGSAIYFARQAHSSPLLDYYQQPLNASASKLDLNQLHLADQKHGVFNSDKSSKAYIYQGNIFVKAMATGEITQLTKFNRAVTGVQFLNSGALAYWQGESIFKVHPETGLIEQIADIQMAKAPSKVKEPTSYIAKQQHRLIDYVSMQHNNAKEKQAYQQQLADVDPTMTAEAWYLGDKERVVELSLSPDGRYVLLALIDKSYSWRSEHDIMPNYLGSEGYVDAVPARARVAEDNNPGQRLVLLNLQTKDKRDITIEGLTGYNEDVLAAVKKENAAAKGESYSAEQQPRKIQLMQDWGWSQSAIQWHKDGQLAVMVEAIDNKDRWIATVDLKKGSLQTQHRLHDDAWVNYTFNQYGWLNDSNSLYYLSEESGYSQLYIKSLGGQPRALTKGNYVVSDITLGPKQTYIYYKANKQHPGIDNVYRVNIQSGESEQLTQWQGQLDYQLSPNGEKLLLKASTRIQPAELFVKTIGGERKQLTNYTSDAFKQYPWQAPEVVAVPSTHGAKDVYARVYLPQGYSKENADKYPAVIFNHGAGYLQNAHYGFSGYFREFMFHNLLTQQGYVVMDMDYRGSKGYGRDWRTAIYRQMGTPEVQDLKDGVKWMAENVNVDDQRVGTYGGSYGGFLTFMALFNEPELFQAGAALRPVTDWAHYNAPYTSNILNTPDVDPIAYERSSPIEHAQGLQKPLLIMSGVLDDNVFFQDSVRLVQRLIELEKPMFETAIYPVEPHGFKQPSSWLDEYRRIYKLFEQELK